MDYSIFPVEFHSILNRLKKDKNTKKSGRNSDYENSCIFLKNHACTIYENRPVICRTHGLPLLFMNENYEWELSNCELNFKKFDFDDFDTQNTFPMDKFNSKLLWINKKIIAGSDRKYSEFDLIPLKEIIDYT